MRNIVITSPKPTVYRHFADVGRSFNYSPEFLRHKTQFEEENHSILTLSTDYPLLFNEDFTLDKLKRAVKSSRNSSPGKDCCEMFRHLSTECCHSSEVLSRIVLSKLELEIAFRFFLELKTVFYKAV